MSTSLEKKRDDQIDDIEKEELSLKTSGFSGDTEARPPAHVEGVDAEIAEFFAQNPHLAGIVIDEAENKRLRWMIHKRVLVVMVVTYFAQTLDKGTINFASIMGIREDTKLHGQQYAWLTTCLYIVILVVEFPTNRIIQRFPIGKILAFNIISWGIVLACTAACTNFVGLVTVRTLLGAFECICQPAFVFLSTMWYRREEQGLIIASFYAMNGFQQCVGGLLAYGIAHIKHAAIKNWQVLFTLLGSCTVAWGIFVLYWLPDSPMRAKCWSMEDRVKMVERVRANDTGIQNKQFKWYQFKEGLMDPVVWAVTLISFTNALPTGGLGAFSNIILKQFGFTVLQTYLLAIAQGSVIMSFLFSAAYIAKRVNQKLLLAFIYTLPNVIGTIVFLSVPPNPSTKVGLYISFLLTQAFAAVAVLNLAVMSGNIAGRTKQVVATSLVFIFWAGGNAAGPQVFRTNDAPRYRKAFTAHIVVYAIQCATILFLRIYLMRRNVLKRRDQAKTLTKTSGEDKDERIGHKMAFDDLTDRENPDFRYVY
ncbi:MFS general substrate transporter [Atractiella rhizophila]|nr:MFS general substrate transporter [Atractiella rhizophila]